MKKKNIFIDIYGATDVYDLNTLVFCSHKLFDKKEIHQYVSLPLTEEKNIGIYKNLNKAELSVITNVGLLCYVIFTHHPISTIQKLSQLYNLNFLSTPFRDFPDAFPESYAWFEKQHEIPFGEYMELSYRDDLTIGDFKMENSNGEIEKFRILFEEEEFYNIRDFINSIGK